MNKVAREVAEAEIKSWLDKKKVFESTRESYKDSIEVLVDAMVEGYLTLDEKDFTLTHTLMFPPEKEQSFTELKYKSRLNDNMLQPFLSGVKTSDADGRLLAYVAALTGVNRGILKAIDTADKKISMAIAIFFL